MSQLFFCIIFLLVNLSGFASEVDDFHHKSFVEEKDETGRTKLHHAARDRDIHPTYLNTLIEKGFTVNARDAFGYTPLIFAAMNNNTEKARILLQHKADPNIVDRDGRSALYYALSHKAEEIVFLLIPVTLMNIVDKYGLMPLHWVARWGNLQMMQEALHYDHHEHINTQIHEAFSTYVKPPRITPLISAAQAGNPNVVRLLLESGATETMNARDKDKRTALMWAIYAKSPETAEVLLEFGATPEIASKKLFVPPETRGYLLDKKIKDLSHGG